MTLASRLTEYISACFTGLWIESHEHEDALREIAQMCHDRNWRLATFDLERGLQIPGTQQAADASGSDPLAAIRAINALGHPLPRELSPPSAKRGDRPGVGSADHHRQNRTFVVILSPTVAVPLELEKLFVVVSHDLPGREQLEEIARGIATEEGELPEGSQLQTALDAAAGLTRYEAEGAFSLSLVRHGRIEPQAVWELKAGMLKKSGLLQLHRGGERFADLGGLEALKAFCARAMRRQAHPDPRRRPRGALLLGVPGTGKSAYSKALGAETGRPTLIMDVGALMGSLVGATESNIRQALKIADAMAPAVLMIDEVEKALSGVASSGSTDSGVSARLFGTLLTWLNDHESDVFTICTCNDISKLPPEFSRAERFDGIFFLDLPGVQQKRAIWKQYLELFELDRQQPQPVDADWSGAEIRSCCRLAALLDVPLVEAAKNVVPVATTAAESVQRLRHWASGRCLNADAPGGIYRRDGVVETSKPARKVRRDPSAN